MSEARSAHEIDEDLAMLLFEGRPVFNLAHLTVLDSQQLVSLVRSKSLSYFDLLCTFLVPKSEGLRQNPPYAESGEIVFGHLILTGITRLEKFKFPKVLLGNLDLSNLEFATDVEFPEYVEGKVHLGKLKTADRVTLPKWVRNMAYGADLEDLDDLWRLALDLRSLVVAKDVIFPKQIDGDLDLSALPSLIGVTLPDLIEENLDLSGLDRLGVDCKLPETVGGHIDLTGVQLFDDVQSIAFPKILESVIFSSRIDDREIAALKRWHPNLCFQFSDPE